VVVAKGKFTFKRLEAFHLTVAGAETGHAGTI
jgi:hypothetical protein